MSFGANLMIFGGPTHAFLSLEIGITGNLIQSPKRLNDGDVGRREKRRGKAILCDWWPHGAGEVWEHSFNRGKRGMKHVEGSEIGVREMRRKSEALFFQLPALAGRMSIFFLSTQKSNKTFQIPAFNNHKMIVLPKGQLDSVLQGEPTLAGQW